MDVIRLMLVSLAGWMNRVMCQKSITLCNPLEVGDLNIEKVDFST